MRAWGHVRTFTPWEMNVSARAGAAWAAAPDGSTSTGHELADGLLEPLATQPRARLRLGTRVLAVGREGLLKHEAIGSEERAARPFRLLLRTRAGGSRSSTRTR